MSNLGHEIARSTIAEILERHGIEPALELSRKASWKEVLSRHWELFVAADFFTMGAWTRRELQRSSFCSGRVVYADGAVDEPNRLHNVELMSEGTL